MRTSDLLAATALLLAGCSSRQAADPVAAAPDDDRIECALAGAADFTRDCSAEQAGAAGEELILHRRDGGFRRLRVVTDGRVLAAADGAEQPVVQLLPDKSIEVAIGGDRYRLPAAMTQ